MAHIDYKDGYFCGIGTYEERHIWKKAGFTRSALRKCWVTPDQRLAEQVKVPWTDRALRHVEEKAMQAELSAKMSYAATTDFKSPIPDKIHPITGKPLEPFRYQDAGVEYCLPRQDALIADQPGLGKEMSIETPIYTPTGWRKMGDLKVGDLVYSIDGKPTKVLAIYPQGVKPNYEITFRDGTTTNCGLEHLWYIGCVDNRSRNKRNGIPEYTVKTLKHILESGILRPRKGNRKGARWYIPFTAPIDHPEAVLPIDPYILGVLLGDGCTVMKNGVRFSAAPSSDDVVENVKKRLPSNLQLRRYQYNDSCPYYTFVGEGARDLRKAIDALEVNVHSYNKFIPEIYKRASASQRLDLLRGLMDTDGSCQKNRTTFHTTSPYLATDVRELVQSLGGMAIRRWYDRSHEWNKPCEAQVNVKLDICPFYMERKAKQWRPYLEKRRYIQEVTRIEDTEQICITVEHPSHLYLVEHFIVTHNTLQGILLFNADEKIKQVLIICPAGLKIHWKREFDLWKTRNVTVGIAEAKRKELVRVGTYKNGNSKYKWTENPDFWPDTDVVVINYHILERFSDKIKGHTWDLLICDEAHALKTVDSSRTLQVLGGYRTEETEMNGRKFRKRVRYEPIAAMRRLFLTGTPIMNRPVELWPMIKAFDPDGLGKDYTRYVYRYCDAFFDSGRGPKGALNVLGASNQEELGQKLREAFMIRRLRKEVQPDLPEKQRRVVIVDSPEIRGLVMKEDELTQALGLYENTILKGIEAEHERDTAIGTMVVERARLMGLDAALSDPDKPNFSKLDVDYISAITGLAVPEIQIIFEQIATVRRDLGLAKMSATVPWIKDFLDGGDKLVVFGYHTDVVKGLAEELQKYNPAVIWGGTPPGKRQAEVDKFQEDESCRVIILNIDAGGVGYTLTRAKDVAFVEGDWVPSKLQQAFDRVCRIGQLANSLMGYFLVANGSLDCRIAQSAQMKEENIDRILDS